MISLSRHLVGISWDIALFFLALFAPILFDIGVSAPSGHKSNEPKWSIFLKSEHKTPGFETDKSDHHPENNVVKQNKKTTVVPTFYR